MAKDYDNEDGVWRTVGGRRIFIRTGQSLSDAMKESGKFSRVAKNQELYKKTEKESKEIEDKLKDKEETKDHTFNMNDEEKRKYEEVGKKIDNLTKEIDESKEKISSEEYNKKLDDEYAKLKNKEITSDEYFKNTDDIQNKYTTDKIEKGQAKAKEENERLEIAKDIAKELNPSLKNASDERLEKEAKNILSHPDGYVLEKGETTYTNSNGEIEKSTESLKKWQEDLKKTSESDTFKQTSTNPFYPDKEYTQEELKKMGETGVRPMKDSYGGNGWEGVNSDKNLSTKEQAKAITDEMKKKYPDVKISRKSELYSGGSSVHLDVMSSDKDLYVTDADIDKMSLQDLSDVTRSNNFQWWAKDNVEGYKENKAMYSDKDVKKYAKERLAEMKKSNNQSVRGDEWYLSDYGKQVMTDLNKTANSYTYDDSDVMTDYFNHGTYMWVNIGKYDKPYQVNEKATNGNQISNALQQKAYEKYLKEHPNSEMKFEDFMKKK